MKKKIKRIIAVVVAIIVVLTAWRITPKTVGVFDYRFFIGPEYDVDLPESGLLESVQPLTLAGLDDYLRDPDGGICNGVVAVVRPIRSENQLIYKERDGANIEYISLQENSAKIGSASFEQMKLSRVFTTVEIIEVLYQSSATEFKKGDTTIVQEPYYIADRRVSNILNMAGGNLTGQAMITHYSWEPMKKGEVYLIFGDFRIESDDEIIDSTIWLDSLHGAYYLKDLNRKIGGNVTDERHAQNIEWLKANYDIEKYMK